MILLSAGDLASKYVQPAVDSTVGCYEHCIRGSIYFVGQSRGLLRSESPSGPNESLPLEKGKALLEEYKEKISLTMKLDLPMELSRIVRDYIGPPPVFIVEPNDLILDMFCSVLSPCSTFLLRRRKNQDTMPLCDAK